jgi:hypothetical protein
VVLHIGTHKTGTTSLQYFLRTARDDLLREAGVSYPDGLVLPTAHAELPLLTVRQDRTWPARIRFPEVQDPRWLAAAHDHVRAQLAAATGDTVIFSHEDLSYLRHDDELEHLRSLLQPLPVVVVVYLRDKASFLRSYREQLEVTGFGATDDPTSYAYTDADSWLVDYDALIDGYERIVGPVDVVDYDAVVERDGSILASFADRTGIPRDALPPPGQLFLNRSGMQLRPTQERIDSIRRRLAAQAQQ